MFMIFVLQRLKILTENSGYLLEQFN